MYPFEAPFARFLTDYSFYPDIFILSLYLTAQRRVFIWIGQGAERKDQVSIVTLRLRVKKERRSEKGKKGEVGQERKS